MPDLLTTLQKCDLGYLRIVASIWGVELTSTEKDNALQKLVELLIDPKLFYEIFDSLLDDALAALDALVSEGGKILWASFTRRYGQVREVGAGRRDREQVFLHPISTAEALYYRALIARAFFDTSAGLQEFAYIPDDLFMLIRDRMNNNFKVRNEKESTLSEHSEEKSREILGYAATVKEHGCLIPANDHILDDITTLLAALRLGWQAPPHFLNWRYPLSFLTHLLNSANLITDSNLQTESIRLFLEMSRQDALFLLEKTWRDSKEFNDLRQIPNLICEGDWKNDSLSARSFILDCVYRIPKNQWWNLAAFIHAIKEKHPDFQRPAGDYDSWFIKQASDGTYLRGFNSWDEVDGALIRYIITGPMFWLGIVDLAAPEKGAQPTSFRIINPESRSPVPENGKLRISSKGKITIPKLLVRAAHYQIARFCDWEEEKDNEYHYCVSPYSLNRARAQGLKVKQLLLLLKKRAATPLPPAFIRALQRWETRGTEAWIENRIVLSVSSPEVLKELRKSRAARFLGEVLSPVTVVVKPGAQSKVLSELTEIGLLVEDKTTSRQDSSSLSC